MARTANVTSINAVALRVQTDVPLPFGGAGRISGWRSALKDLSGAPVGASVFFPKDAVGEGSLRQVAIRVMGKGCCTVRQVEGGWRAWKTAEQSNG